VTTPFVAQLRSKRPPIELANGAGALTLRVEVADQWDAVRVVVSESTLIAEIKNRVVSEFYPDVLVDDLMLKFRGWEILDENVTVKDVGLLNGSIVLLGYRRRRPVR